MTVEFYSGEYGGEYVKLTNGKKYMDARIDIKSKNGRFSAIADLWYEDVPFVDEDGEQDVSTEDIEGSETLVVFDHNAVAYTIKGIDRIDEDNTILRDDGTIALFDNDERLIVHTLAGKKINRKPTYEVADTRLDEDAAYFWGDDDDFNSKFTVFQFATLTSWTRGISKTASFIQNVLLENGFIFVQYETYDDELGISKYALDGKKIGDVKYPKPQKQKTQKTAKADTKERDEKPAPIRQSTSPKKSKPKPHKWIIWLIAILVVGTIVRCSQ